MRKQAKKITIKCDYCENDFEKLESRMKYAKRHYCSVECSDLHKKTTMSGKNSPNYGRKHTEEHKAKIAEATKQSWKNEEIKQKRLLALQEIREERADNNLPPLGWGKQAIEKRKQTLTEKYGVPHNWSNAECREKCEETTKERYGKNSWDLASEGITDEVIERRRITLIETMLGIPYEEYEDYVGKKRVYYNAVMAATNKQPLHELEHYEKRGITGVEGAYHLDHIIPINYGFHKGIDPEIIGSINNLRFIPWYDNVSKGDKLIEELNAMEEK